MAASKKKKVDMKNLVFLFIASVACGVGIGLALIFTLIAFGG